MPEGNPICLGFDFGLKRIGIAVGHRDTGHASPLKIFSSTKEGLPWREIDRLIKEWRPPALVVGIPYNMDGSLSSLALLARGFADELRNRYSLEVYETDERLSTKAARSGLEERFPGQKKPRRVDNLAAVVILEQWMADQERAKK